MQSRFCRSSSIKPVLAACSQPTTTRPTLQAQAYGKCIAARLPDVSLL
jgi:hypothetical protein